MRHLEWAFEMTDFSVSSAQKSSPFSDCHQKWIIKIDWMCRVNQICKLFTYLKLQVSWN